MPLLEKTNIDQVIMNGDSTNAEDDDYGLKDEQRNNGVTKTQDVGCFYDFFVYHFQSRVYAYLRVPTVMEKPGKDLVTETHGKWAKKWNGNPSHQTKNRFPYNTGTNWAIVYFFTLFIDMTLNI